jgi:hypothetical protein
MGYLPTCAEREGGMGGGGRVSKRGKDRRVFRRGEESEGWRDGYATTRHATKTNKPTTSLLIERQCLEAAVTSSAGR